MTHMAGIYPIISPALRYGTGDNTEVQMKVVGLIPSLLEDKLL